MNKSQQQNTHQCPGPDCTKCVPYHMLMCRDCWRDVPSAIKSQVYAAWDNGAGRGTKRHQEAMERAVQSLREVSAH